MAAAAAAVVMNTMNCKITTDCIAFDYTIASVTFYKKFS